MLGEFTVGDIGATIKLTVEEGGVALDISSASSVKKFRLRKPESNNVIEVDASFDTDGTDGVLKWTTTLASDLDEAGEWKVQPYLEMSIWSGHTLHETFVVNPKI